MNKVSRLLIILIIFSTVYVLDNKQQDRFLSKTPSKPQAAKVIETPHSFNNAKKNDPKPEPQKMITFPNRPESTPQQDKGVSPQKEILAPSPNPVNNEQVNEEPPTQDNPQFEETREDDYNEDDFHNDSTQDQYDQQQPIQENYDNQQIPQYQPSSIVLCQAYVPYCEPKEIYETRERNEIEYCLTTYEYCIDENKNNISAPMNREDADIYIQKKMESFYKENY